MDPGHDTGDVDVNLDDLGVVVVGQSNSSVPSGQSLKYTFLDYSSFKVKNYLKPLHLLSLAIHSPPSHRHSDGLHKSEIVKSSVQQEFLQ